MSATAARYPYAQGANSSTGNATVTDVLSPYTFSNAEQTGLTGTMPNKVGSGTVITPSTSTQAISQGYYSGAMADGEVVGDTNLITGNIRAGVSIFSVSGKSSVVDTASATATATQILSGYTAYANGASISGSMANNGGLSYNPSTSSQNIPAGYTSGGTVSAVTGTATVGNVLSGSTFSSASGISQTGTMPNEGAVTLTPLGTGTVAIPAGYHNGSGIVSQVSVPAANVLTGTTIASVAGTMPNEGSPTLAIGASITPGYYGGGSVATYPHGSQSYTATGSFTFTVPANVTEIIVATTGAGGGGAACYNSSSYPGAGGGSGGTAFGIISVTPGQQISGSIGTGGVGGTSNNGGTGFNGSASTFGSLTGNGGSGGSGGSSNLVRFGGAAGTASGGSYNVGSFGADSWSTNQPGSGGASFFSLGGVANSSTAGPAGSAGSGGAGGGYSASPLSGGAGGDGQVTIWW